MGFAQWALLNNLFSMTSEERVALNITTLQA
jgi:hypothetical protein